MDDQDRCDIKPDLQTLLEATNTIPMTFSSNTNNNCSGSSINAKSTDSNNNNSGNNDNSGNSCGIIIQTSPATPTTSLTTYLNNSPTTSTTPIPVNVCVMATENSLQLLDQNLEKRKNEIESTFVSYHNLLDTKLKLSLERLKDVYTRTQEEIHTRLKQKSELEDSRSKLTDPSLTYQFRDFLNKMDQKISDIDKNIEYLSDIKLSWNPQQLTHALNNVLIFSDVIQNNPTTQTLSYFLSQDLANINTITPTCNAITISTTTTTPHSFSRIGTPNSVPREPFSISKVVTSGPGSTQLCNPCGLVIDREINNIFIADRDNNRIQAYNDKGEHSFEIKDRHLHKPTDVCIMKKYLYTLSQFERDLSRSKLMKFDRKDGELVAVLELQGISPNEEVKLATSRSSRVCVAINKKTIQVFDSALRFCDSVNLKVPHLTAEVKLTAFKLVYLDAVNGFNIHVLFKNSTYPLQLFNSTGNLIRVIPLNVSISQPSYFCLHPSGSQTPKYYVISDESVHLLKIYSLEGICLQIIGSDSDSSSNQSIKLDSPQGVDVNANGELIFVDRNSNNLLHISKLEFT